MEQGPDAPQRPPWSPLPPRAATAARTRPKADADADRAEADADAVKPKLAGPNGTFEPSPKHDVDRAGVGRQPTNGQQMLDKSLSVGPNTSRRIAADPATGEFVVFDETLPGQQVFHGHVRQWSELSPQMQAALRKAGKVNAKGKITK